MSLRCSLARSPVVIGPSCGCRAKHASSSSSRPWDTGNRWSLSSGSTSRPGATAWLSLDLIDRSPQSFWMHLVGGLRRVLPTIDDELGLLLAERGPDHVFVAALLRQIEQAGRPVNLVLDDLALIEDRSTIDGLALLVERVGHVVRVPITNRMTPLLPLARWRSLGWLVEVGENDLRLDHDEARSIASRSGRPVDDPGVLELCDQFDGWPLGFHLTLMSNPRGQVPTGSAGPGSDSERQLADYLVTEVIDRLPPEHRDVAFAIAVPQWFDLDFARRLLGSPAVPIIRVLQRQRLFLDIIDDERGAMRFHSFVRTVLVRELIWRDPALHDDLHRRAAAIWADRGDVAEAHRLSVSIGDLAHAFTLVIAPTFDLINRGDAAGAARLMVSFPCVTDVEDRPSRSDIAVASFFARNHDEASRWSDRAAQLLIRSDPTAQVRLHALRGALSLMRGDVASAAANVVAYDLAAPLALRPTTPS